MVREDSLFWVGSGEGTMEIGPVKTLRLVRSGQLERVCLAEWPHTILYQQVNNISPNHLLRSD
jgi:hypothetical protein